MKQSKLSHYVATFICALAMVGCQEDLADNDHYKPQSSTGNAYEVLQAEGNHSIFLKGVDLSGYQQIVDGKSILTVMAPSDDAFTQFLADKGYASIDEMNTSDPQYLKKLIGFHLMYYAFDWDKMVNFRPDEGDGATDDEKAMYAGLYYKHRTRSQNPIEREARVKLTANAINDTTVTLYHYERYLPVFSNKFFETKGIDAAYNYNYFYPNTEWGNKAASGADGYFNVSNAAVTDASAVITDNGYLYHVDHVLEPLNTIYDELANNPDYSDFLSLYNTYSSYVQVDDEVATELGKVAYLHYHDPLPNIALEWPSTNYLQFSQLEMMGYNLFVPTNAALDNFFKTFWTAEGGYSQLSDLDDKILYYFIYQSFASNGMIMFPEEITNGYVKTPYGTTINIDPEKVTDRHICANGALYGMDQMEAPAIFSSVVGPAFKDTTYLYYLYALDGSDLMLSLASDNSQFVTLMPSNEQLRNAELPLRLFQSEDGKTLQQFSTDAGDYADMGSSAKLNMVNIHTATNVSELPAEGTSVIKSNTAYNYWFVRDGKITCSNSFNQLLNPSYTSDPFVGFHEITNNGSAWSNGRSYSYDATAPFEATSGEGLSHMFAVGNDKNYPYYMFSQLLQKAGMIEDGALSTTVVATGTRFIAFVPSNDVLTAKLNELPGCGKLSINDDGSIKGTLTSSNKSLLAAYLRSYFVTSLQNTFSDYPYPGSTCNGLFYTMGNYGKMQINDNGSSLSVKFVDDESVGNEVSVSSAYYNLPFAFSDGCFHIIDDILN